jgi:transcriptional regulator with XRE-family HTH domain
MESIGTRLHRLRHFRGVTQQAVAERARCSQALVALWEADQREPLLGQLVAVADVLDVPLKALTSGLIASTTRMRWPNTTTNSPSSPIRVAALHAARGERGLSLIDAGRAADIAPRRLRAIEHGRQPSFAELLALLRLYDLTLDEIVEKRETRLTTS